MAQSWHVACIPAHAKEIFCGPSMTVCTAHGYFYTTDDWEQNCMGFRNLVDAVLYAENCDDVTELDERALQAIANFFKGK